jgi:hypothetical protein
LKSLLGHLDDPVHRLIVMSRVVMEKYELSHLAVLSDAGRFQPGGMSPAPALFVLLGCVLGIKDEGIRPGAEVAYDPVVSGVSVFEVGGVHHDGVLVFEPVTNTALWMVEREGPDPKISEMKRVFVNFHEGLSGRRFGKGYGKVRRLHLAGQLLVEISMGMENQVGVGVK